MSKGIIRNRIVLAVCIGAVLMATVLLTGCPTPEAPPAYLLQWGSNGTGDGQFSDLTLPGIFHSTPTGVAADAAGNIYVTDTGANRIQKFNSAGVFLAKWGTLGTGNGQFKYPRGIAVDTAGNVYVTDTDNNRIQKFSGTGAFLGKWGSFGTTDGLFDSPRGITVDFAGNVYVVDSSNHRVQKFSSTGAFIGKWGSLGYVGSGGVDGQFFHPHDIAVDSAGNVYVTDSYNNRIQKFSSAGVFLAKWGSYWYGVGPGDGRFYEPQGIAVDSAGNVYVVDSNNSRIQKFNSAGVFLVKWGTLGTGNGQFGHPLGIAVDSAVNVYVADSDNNRIQKFGKSSGLTLVPGVGEAKPDPNLDTKPKPLLPGTIIVNATLDGVAWTGPVGFTATGTGLPTFSGTVVPLPSPNVPVGTYTLNYLSGGPSGATLLSTTPSATQALTAGDTITFTLNFRTKPVDTGTINVNATLDGILWTVPGTVNFTLTGPQTYSGATPQAYANVPVGNYTVAWVSGTPPNASFVNTTPTGSQTLTTGGTITFNINFRSKPVDTGRITVNATLNNVPWTAGSVNFSLGGPSPISGTYPMATTFPNMIVGNYTIAWVSGGPTGGPPSSITNANTQTLTPNGTTTFTLNFTEKPVDTGRITVNATLNNVPWTAGSVNFSLGGPSPISGTYPMATTFPNMIVGNYTIAYISGGPNGTTLFNITPSPTQALTAGGTITFTLNFRTEEVAHGTIIVNATWRQAMGIAPWTGTLSFTLTGPSPISGTSVPQTYAGVPVGTYTLNYISGGPPGTTLFNTTPSTTQALTAGGTITFTMEFR